LILTTNRVGTFDEAFKSRIRLALHYEKLTKKTRTKIWSQFIDHLANIDEVADFDELRDRIDLLAEPYLNGRQIRSAVTTGIQLARSRRSALQYNDLRQAMRMSERFEDYIKAVVGGDEDTIAMDTALRAPAVRDIGL
jgi:hypothetical protein